MSGWFGAVPSVLVQIAPEQREAMNRTLGAIRSFMDADQERVQAAADVRASPVRK